MSGMSQGPRGAALSLRQKFGMAADQFAAQRLGDQLAGLGNPIKRDERAETRAPGFPSSTP